MAYPRDKRAPVRPELVDALDLPHDLLHLVSDYWAPTPADYYEQLLRMTEADAIGTNARRRVAYFRALCRHNQFDLRFDFINMQHFYAAMGREVPPAMLAIFDSMRALVKHTLSNP